MNLRLRRRSRRKLDGMAMRRGASVSDLSIFGAWSNVQGFAQPSPCHDVDTFDPSENEHLHAFDTE